MRLASLFLLLIISSCNSRNDNKKVKYSIKDSVGVKLDSSNLFGKWTEEVWVGVENSNLPPPPPAIIPEHDTIWPPYYEIDKNEIRHYFLGIDSAKYKINKTGNVLTLDGLRTLTIGYQKEWQILTITDSTMIVERRFGKNYYESPNAISYFDETDTVTFYRKR